MKYIFVLLFSILFSLNLFGQTEQIVDETKVGVEEIYLAKDDGNGEAGEEASEFFTTDIPIYCVVQLNSTTPATVKMNFIAVSVKGVKAETKVVTVSYKTNGKQSRVNFTGAPDGVWTVGTYRVDIFLDGKPAGNKEFEIKSKSADTKMTNTFQPTPTPTPKTPSRKRKN